MSTISRDTFNVIPDLTSEANFWFNGGVLVDNNGAIVHVDPGVVFLDLSGPNYVEQDGNGVVSSNTTAFSVGSYPLYYITMVNSVIDKVYDLRGSPAVPTPPGP